MRQQHKQPAPIKIYQKYLMLIIACIIIGIAGVFAAVGAIGDVEIPDFNEKQMSIFAILIIGEIAVTILMFIFAMKARGLIRSMVPSASETENGHEMMGLEKYGEAIAHIEFNEQINRRMLILSGHSVFNIVIETYSTNTGQWVADPGISCYPSMAEAKSALNVRFPDDKE